MNKIARVVLLSLLVLVLFGCSAAKEPTAKDIADSISDKNPLLHNRGGKPLFCFVKVPVSE